LAKSGVTSGKSRSGRARWVVLTPSVDDAAWRGAIIQAAHAAGLQPFDPGSPEANPGDPDHLFITDDASVAIAADPAAIVGIMPEPETAPDAVAMIYSISAPTDVWHASLLLARAAALEPKHVVVGASDLGQRPRLLRLFGEVEVTPPVSKAEASRRATVTTAFGIYRDLRKVTTSPIPFSEKIFIYDERSSRNWPDWGVLDVTGRPRILVWGPYIALPPGMWRAVIRLGFDAAAAKHHFRVDWGSQTACVSEQVSPRTPGVYELQLDWQFEEAAPAELRLILTEGSFMGTVMFQGITVQRVPAPPPGETIRSDQD